VVADPLGVADQPEGRVHDELHHPADPRQHRDGDEVENEHRSTISDPRRPRAPYRPSGRGRTVDQ
jgi:hypothetical protein